MLMSVNSPKGFPLRSKIIDDSLTIIFDLGLLALRPCHAVAYDMQSEMSSSPTGGLRLPAGKHTSILTDFQTMVKKKIKKLDRITGFFNHEGTKNIATKKYKMHKRDKKMTKKVLYKHINNWIPAGSLPTTCRDWRWVPV